MTERPIRGQKHQTPLRYWLASNLPTDPPFRTSSQTWSLAQRFAAGDPVGRLAEETGLSPEAITQRLMTLARKIGYQSPSTTAWLLPEGRLADHSVRVDEASGCLVWTGYLEPKATGPYEHLPRSHWPAGHTGPMGPRVLLRQFLWEQTYGLVPGNLVVSAACGDRRCLALEHAALRVRRTSVAIDDVASTIDRKAEETRGEAAARLRVSQHTITQWRGPGGRKEPMTAPLRAWLIEHLPQHQPASTAGRDWSAARRYAAGETLASIATDERLTPQAIHHRIRKLAMTLGYTSEHGSTSGTVPTRDHR